MPEGPDSLAAGVTLAPFPYDTKIAKASATFASDLPAGLRDVAVAAAGSSPYLAQLIERHGAWLQQLADTASSAVFDGILAGLETLPPDQLAPALRQAKGRVALYLALADLGGWFDVHRVTNMLSDFADRAVDLAFRACFAAEQARGRFDFLEDQDSPCGGLGVIAMGKHGARELNYSSDIDLIVLFVDEDADPQAYLHARKAFVRVTQAAAKLLSENTADGYVFRTDLRLRPDPGVTPVALGFDAAERYYESLGRTWERAAYIKARAIAGDIASAQEFLQRLDPFVWRRYLDFVALKDTRDMLIKIRDHKGLRSPISFPGHDVKLGRGGIREIEFFAQTQQLIFGGRAKGLRVSETVPALRALQAEGHVAPDVAAGLIAAYRDLRWLEHRLQMINDAQTHAVPSQPDQIARLACLCGMDADALEQKFLKTLEYVHGVTALEDVQAEPVMAASSEALAQFEARWAVYPAFRTERARALFDQIRPRIEAGIEAVQNPEITLQALDTFLEALPAGVQLFSLFDARPQLLDLLLEICGTTPALAQYLGQNPAVLDAVMDRAFFALLDDAPPDAGALSDMLRTSDDFETCLDLVRRWKKEQHFRVGVHLLRGISSITAVEHSYSAIADACIAALMQVVQTDFQTRHGTVAGGDVAVLAMGKLGSREMTASSDLDLIVVYDLDEGAQSSGPRVLDGRQYFSKLTQRLISAITSATAEGALYEVDMRLRPSGRKGPVATGLRGFREYQSNEAWTWEHLALTRARVVTGSAHMHAALDGAIEDALGASRKRADVLADVADMRARLMRQKGHHLEEFWNFKHGAGRMLDIELCFQTGLLLEGARMTEDWTALAAFAVSSGLLTSPQAKTLADCHKSLKTVQHGLRLIGLESSPDTNPGAAVLIIRLLGMTNLSEVKGLIDVQTRGASRVIDAVLT